MKIICSICLEKFTEKSDVSSTPCGHLFHSNCLSRSLVTTKNECPQCRANCSKNVHKVFLQCEPDDNENSQSEPAKNSNTGDSQPLDLQHPQRNFIRSVLDMSQQAQPFQHPQRPLGPQPFQHPQQLQELHLPLDLQHPRPNVIRSKMSQQPQLFQHPQRLIGPQPFHQAQIQKLHLPLDLQHPRRNVMRSNISKQPQHPRQPREPKKPQPAHQCQLYLYQHSQTPQQPQQPREPQLPKQPQPAHQSQPYITSGRF